MNKDPKPTPVIKHPPRVDEVTQAFFDKIPGALSHLLGMDPKQWVKTLPLREVESIKLTLGTDGGISVYYESKGTQYQYHIEPEHLPNYFGSTQVPYQGLDRAQPGKLTTSDNLTQTGRLSAAEPNEGGTPQADKREDDTKPIKSVPPEESQSVPNPEDSDIRSEPPADEVPT